MTTAVAPSLDVINFEQRIVKESVRWVYDDQWAILACAFPSLLRGDLLTLSRRYLDARWETLFAKERAALLEFLLQLGDHSVQCVDGVTQLRCFESC